MNGKQAKRLRRAAMGLAATLSEAGKDIKKDGYLVKEYERRLNMSSSVRGDVVEDLPPTLRSRQVLIRRDSVKGIYRQLKSGKV